MLLQLVKNTPLWGKNCFKSEKNIFQISHLIFWMLQTAKYLICDYFYILLFLLFYLNVIGGLLILKFKLNNIAMIGLGSDKTQPTSPRYMLQNNIPFPLCYIILCWGILQSHVSNFNSGNKIQPNFDWHHTCCQNFTLMYFYEKNLNIFVKISDPHFQRIANNMIRGHKVQSHKH